MQLSQIASPFIAQIIVLDIAPVTYCADSHTLVFKAIDACFAKQLTDRKAIHHELAHYLSEPTIQFLLKSYKERGWLFNYKAIENHYVDIRGWHEIETYHQPVLFIRGSESNYITEDYYTDIVTQFPYATIKTVEGANHNVHNEQPQHVIAYIKDWLK